MTALFRLALALLIASIPSLVEAQAQMMTPGPTVGPMPGAPPGPDEYPNPTDIDWGDPDKDPCDFPFPIALCDDMTGGDLTPEAGDDDPKGDGDDDGDGTTETGGFVRAAEHIHRENEALVERNPAAAFIKWVAETFGPNVPTGTTSESNREDRSETVYDVGDRSTVRSFAAFVDPLKVGDAVASSRPGQRPRVNLTLGSRWEMNADDNDEYVVRVEVQRGRRQMPIWIVARYGRLFIVLPDRGDQD